MKKRIPTRYFMAMIAAIMLVIFNIVVFASLGDKVKFQLKSFWVGYAFIDFAIIAIGVSCLFVTLKKGAIFSQIAPTISLLGIYFVAAAVLNIIAMVVNTNKITVFLVLNFVFILLFAAAVILAFVGGRHISENIAEVEKKVKYINLVKASVEVLVERATDIQLKTALKGLLEDVTYSDPMSGDDPDVEREEAKLKTLVDSIEESLDLIEAGDTSTTVDSIKVLVVQAKNCVKKRNALVKAAKS